MRTDGEVRLAKLDGLKAEVTTPYPIHEGY